MDYGVHVVWETEERAIVVKERCYAVQVVLECAVLVFRGIMVGCFIGRCLPRVDLLIITVFA